MISTNGIKRKSSDQSHRRKSNNLQSDTIKRFRGIIDDGKKLNSNQHQTSQSLQTQDSTMKSSVTHRDYRQLQYELQCQEALLIFMQKLHSNQKTFSTPSNPTKDSNKQCSTTITNGTSPIVKPSSTSINRTKTSHSNQNIAQRNSQTSPSVTLKTSSSTIVQPTRSLPQQTTKSLLQKSIPANLPTKNSVTSAEQQLLNAKLALRKQLEQTLLQIPMPKPTNCDLNYIPSMTGWAEFLSQLGLEQASNIYNENVNRRPLSELHIQPPNLCLQCGTDWSVTWHKTNENIFCDRCRKSSQKKVLKQDHSNRLRQAFIQALQQEKELDVKFHQQCSTTKKAQPHPRVKHQSIGHRTSIDPFVAFQNNEQFEYLQKYFLSNMIPFAMANQLAAALATKSSSQEQLLAASLPAMAVSLLHQQNPAQYLLDMIPQAAKHHQHRSK